MKKIDLSALIVLTFCLFIYIFYRTEKTVINQLLTQFYSSKSFVEMQQCVRRILPLNKFIIYSLPEGLWVFSATIFSYPFYINIKKYYFYCVYIPIIYPILLEIFQYFNWIHGTFDLIDIIICLFFWLIASLYVKNKSNRENIITSSLTIKKVLFFSIYGIVYLSHVCK